jgi:hypothetical protein
MGRSFLSWHYGCDFEATVVLRPDRKGCNGFDIVESTLVIHGMQTGLFRHAGGVVMLYISLLGFQSSSSEQLRTCTLLQYSALGHHITCTPQISLFQHTGDPVSWRQRIVMKAAVAPQFHQQSTLLGSMQPEQAVIRRYSPSDHQRIADICKNVCQT